MRYLLCKDEQVVDVYEQDSNFITLKYPGLESIAIDVDDQTWQELKTNPENYTYKDGKVVLLA